MKISVYGSSSTGKVRKLNEDSYSFDSSRGDKGSIFLVCDGMGGHKAGEVASSYASIKIVEYFYSSHQKDILSKLNESIRKVNSDLYKLSKKDSSKRGMGTTVAVIVIFENILYFANVGDSRVYLIRNSSIGRLTKDHSWLEERISEGSLSPADARNNPNKNIITKCVGYEPDIEPYFGSFVLKEGDRIILCSDGLWDELDDSDIKNTALSNKDLKKSIEKLVLKAEEHGGKDNITVLGVDYGKVKIKNLNKYRHLIFLSIVSFIAIFFLILSIVFINSNNKNRSENKILQEQLENEKENSDRRVKENQRLKEDIEELQKENENLIKEKEKHEVQRIPENSNYPIVINEKFTVSLEFNYFLNPRELSNNFGNVKEFFAYNKNFLFLNEADTNILFFISDTESEYFPINFKAKESEGNIEINDFVFDSNSKKFYIISTDYIFEGTKDNLFSNNTVVDVDIAIKKALSENITESSFTQYLIIEDYLYYFFFNSETGQIAYYRILDSGSELPPEIIELDIIENNVSPVEIVDISYDYLSERLFVLVISDEANYLCFYQKIDGGFEGQVLKEIATGIPQKILLNSQDNSGPLIYFKDNGFYAYNYNLGIPEHYIIDMENNPGISGVKDVCIDGSVLYVLDDNDIIFSSDFNQQ